MADQPLDVLESARDAPVAVRLKDGEVYEGLLVAFDQHMNVVLEPGDGSGAVPGSTTPVTSVDNTTVIRGDNVVTIQT